MKQRTIEMYSSFPYRIKDYLIKKLKLCEEDEKIERRFKRINDMVMREIVSLASKYLQNSE